MLSPPKKQRNAIKGQGECMFYDGFLGWVLTGRLGWKGKE